MEHEIKIKVEIPDEYEPTGEYRPANRGETFMDGAVATGWYPNTPSWRSYIILRKLSPKAIPEGFEWTGEIREPKEGEWFIPVVHLGEGDNWTRADLLGPSLPSVDTSFRSGKRFILRRKHSPDFLAGFKAGQLDMRGRAYADGLHIKEQP